jgi:RNA polymerase-associated protein
MMTLFSRADDALSHWVRFALAEKALEARVVETDVARPPEDLIDLNPYQAVPTLIDRELVVYEARIVCEYLDERYPHPALLPTDPVGRAQTRVALHRIEQDWYALLPALEGADRRERDRARKLLRDSVVAAEPLFRARPWFLSEQFSVLDIAVAPMLWRLRHWEIDVADAAQSVQRYAQRLFARPAFRTGLSAAEYEMRA